MPRFAKFDVDDEPIEGYKLVDFLGKGQYGEVWKARDVRSGRKLALKIIDLTHSSGALKELRALNQVKNLNHPNLVPIFTAMLKDRKDREVPFEKAEEAKKNGTLKELMILMGLGEQSLAARLKEINPDGTLPADRKGLPIEELIQYMEGAAKGIDFLNRADHGLDQGDGPVIHCDIKPDNMMIVSGEIQIADCGVAVMITPDARQTRAAGSPAYSPPELTANKPGQGSDQYSLAVSYYELRTGSLPFDEEIGLGGIIIAHSQGDLDFSLVGDEERAVLKKATAIRPKDRFESCSKFIRAVAKAADAAAAARLQTTTGSVPVLQPRIPIQESTREVPTLTNPAAGGPGAFPLDRPIPSGRSGVVDFSSGAGDDGRMIRPPSRPSLPGLETAGTDNPTETPRAEYQDDLGPPKPAGRGPLPADPNDPMGGQIRGTVEMDPMIAAILGGKQSPPRRPEAPPPPPPTTVLQPPPPRQLPPPPTAPAQPNGRNAIPADPNDPMGGRIRGTVEMDPSIEAIIKGSGPVRLPDLPPVPPPPEPGVRPETKAKRLPDLPPVPPPPEPGKRPESKAKPRPPAPKPPAQQQSDPIWLQPDPDQPRKSGPVPDQRTSGPVPEPRRSGPVAKKPPSDPRVTIQPGQDENVPAFQAEEKTWVREALREEDIRRSGNLKKSGPIPADNWRGSQDNGYDGGGQKGGSKLLVIVLAAVIGVGGAVGGYFVITEKGSTSETAGAGTNAVATTVPVVTTPTAAAVTTAPSVPNVPQDPAEAAKKKVAEYTARIDSAYLRSDRAALVKIEGAPVEVLALLDAKYSDLAAKDIEKQFADQHKEVIDILEEAKARTWTDAARTAGLSRIGGVAAKKAETFKDTEAKRNVVAVLAGLPGGSEPARALAAGVLKSLFEAAGGPQQKLDALTAPGPADPNPALAAVKAWFDDPLQKTVGAAPIGVPVAAVKAWYDVRKSGAGAEEFKVFDAQFADPGKLPPLPAVLVNEYFRLAADRKKPLADLQATLKMAEGWPNLDPAAKTQIRGGYDAALGQVVKTELSKDNADLKMLADAVGDVTTGWAGAVRAEYLLGEKKEPLTDDDKKVLPVLRAGLRDSAEGSDPELAAYASFVTGLGGNGEAAAKAFAAAYKNAKAGPLAGPARKDRAVTALIKASLLSLGSGAAGNWENPYSNAPVITAAWLKLADDLSENKDARVAMHLALATRNPAAAEPFAVRAMALDPAKIADTDLVSARAFFAARAVKLAEMNKDEACKAAGAGVRVAYRLALSGLRDIKNEDEEAAYIRSAFAPIRSQFISPFLADAGKRGDKISEARLALTDVCMTVLDPTDPLKNDKEQVRQLLSRLKSVVLAMNTDETPSDAALAANPDLADAIGCRGFVMLLGLAPYYGGLYSNDASKSDRPLTDVWKDIRRDAAAAVAVGEKYPVAFYFGNVTRLYLTMAEFGVSRNYACPAVRAMNEANAQEVQLAANAATAAARVHVSFSRRAANDTFAHGKYLFIAANQLAKLGDDPALVKAYLLAAEKQTDLLANEYYPFFKGGEKQFNQQFMAKSLRGLIHEDLAWLCESDAKANYRKAIGYLEEAMQKYEMVNDAKSQLDLYRMRVRFHRYAGGENPFDSPEGQSIKGRPKTYEGDFRVQAYYWTGVAYYTRGEFEAADAAFSDVVDAAGASGDSAELVLLAVMFRGRIAAKGSKPEVYKDLIERATATLDATISVAGVQRKVRDLVPHYAVLPDYLAAQKAVLEKDTSAKAHFAKAFASIAALDGKGRMMIEEPFGLECLADELRAGVLSDPVDVRNRKSLLKNLFRQFKWSVPQAERAAFEALLK